MSKTRIKIGVFGLGEAGSLIASDLRSTGVQINAFDPKPVATPQGINRHTTPQTTVEDADVVIALTASADAHQALNQAFNELPEDVLYADFSTSPSELKKQLAKQCSNRKIQFVDVALMSVVPGKGLKTPALASGYGARRFVKIFSGLGMPVEMIGNFAGEAATRKLLRSVMMKGLAAAIIEAMEGAKAAGCSQWLWENMTAEINNADELLLARLVKGTKKHAHRRLHEMEASCLLLKSLGVDSYMSKSTVETLRKISDK